MDICISTTTAYEDKSIKTEYTYDSAYPGNVTAEAVKEITGETETLIGEKAYVYADNHAQIAQEISKNIITNGTDFTLQAPVDMTVTYTYDTMGRLATETDATGKTTSYGYNGNGWLISTTYPDGSVTETEYVLDKEEGNNKITTVYNDTYTTVDYYDAFGRMSKQCELDNTGKENTLTTYTYDYGRVSKVTDGNGNYTEYGYDGFGRVIWVEQYNSSGEQLLWDTVEYDDINRTKVVSNGGKEKEYYYDVAGRLYQEENDTGEQGVNVTIYESDGRGNLLRTTNAKGNSTRNTYNDQGQLIKTTNALGEETLYEYDPMGNVNKVTYSGGNTVTYTYDNAGRLLKETDVLGNSEHYAYDPNGNLIAYKDKKGQVTTNTYDNMNRLTQKQAGDLSVSYTYDAMGNVTTMTDQTGVTEYTYTYNNLLAGITTPDHKSIRYTYDALGNMTGVTDYAGNTMTYTYDGANRVDTIMQGNTVLTDYKYDYAGQLNMQYSLEADIVYDYDVAGNLVEVTVAQEAGEDLIGIYCSSSYSYDVLGNIVFAGKGTENGYNWANYTYDALNRLTTATDSDGTVTNYTFDAGNNITGKTVTHPAGYDFVTNQNQTAYTMNDVTSHSIAYTYNTANQLLTETESVTGTEGNLSINMQYTYDANGNMILRQKELLTDADTAGEEALSIYNTQATSGSITDAGVTMYAYDSMNHLTQVQTDNNILATYTYDGTGMRVAKTQNNVTQKYYWDRGYVANESIDGIMTATNYLGVDGIFARNTGTGIEFLFKNGHGDVVHTRKNGQEVAGYDYDAYGVQTAGTAADATNPLRYCGEYYDAESGLIYLRNRYYDPSIGRFITEDPIQDGMNWYAYCGNNPVNYVDPLGLWKDGDEKYKYSNPVVYAALNDLTESWNNLNDLINSGTLSESQLVTARSNLLLIGSLADVVRATGDYMKVDDFSLEDPTYGGLNNTEKVIYAGGMGVGAFVGLASVNAGTDTLEYFGYDEDGTTQNAFKHALWNAYAVAYGAGEAYVKNFTDAHELGNPNNFKSAEAYEATRMDLHNNAIGRFWGENYSIFTASHMKDYMKSTLKADALWIIKNRPAE